MSYTISTLNQRNSSLSTWTTGAPIVGQTFRTTGGGLLDSVTLSLESSGAPTQSTQFEAYLYQYDTSTGYRTGPALSALTNQSLQLGASFSSFLIDLDDPYLSPNTSYVFYIQYVSGQGARLGTVNPGTYDGGNFIYTNNINENPYNQTWAARDFAFSLSIIDPAVERQQGLQSPPTGNFNELTNIGINLSGTYTGDGIFSISDPDQTGNNVIKVGKYGRLIVDAITGAFQYTPDQNKIKPLNTGETGVDEFTITLTAANGTVTSSTYRVDIIGDTGSDDGGGIGDISQDKDDSNTKSITIDGSRGSVKGKPGIVVDGETEGFSEGSVIVPYIKFPGQGTYSKANARPTTDEDGSFFWQRKTGKKIYVYFKSENGDVKSNRIIIPRNGRSTLASSSLKTFDDDPIVNGSSGQYSSRKKGKRRQAQTGAAPFGNRLAEDTNSSLLMATDSADAGFYKQHDLVAASSGNW